MGLHQERVCCMHGHTHYFLLRKYIHTLINYIVKSIRGMLQSVALMSRGGPLWSPRGPQMVIEQVSQWIDSWGSFLKDAKSPESWSTCFPRILLRHGSWLYSWSITATTMSACECPSPVKCTTTGDSSVLRWAMLKRWPLTLRCSGWPVSPTYCWPQLLQVIK